MPTGTVVGVAATVNGKRITAVEVKNQRDQILRSQGLNDLSQFQGEMRRMIEKQLYNQALESLVAAELLSAATSAEGVVISDQELRHMITAEIPAFQADGRFVRSSYENYLEGSGLSSGQFEDRLRSMKRQERLELAIENALAPPKDMKLKFEERAKLAANLQALRTDSQEILKRADVSDDQVRSRLKSKDFRKKIEKEFNPIQEKWLAENSEVRARHILVKADRQDEKAVAKAKEKIEALKLRVAQEDFSAVAKAESEDEGSKGNGGDLGFFKRGQMVPEFETVAFSLKLGEVSEPVQTQYGFHIIKLEGLRKNTADDGVFEFAKTELNREASERLLSEVKEKSNAKALKTWAEKNKVTLENLGRLDLNDSNVRGLGSSEEMLLAVAKAIKSSKKDQVFWSANGSTALVRDEAEDSKKGEPKEFNLGERLRSEFLMAWVEQLKKKASIEKNEI